MEDNFRAHPRAWDGGVLLGMYEDLRTAYPNCLTMSTKGRSLYADCVEHEWVMGNQWSGALLQALYLKRPLVGFQPRATINAESDLLIQQLPIALKSGDDMRRFFSESHSLSRETILDRQQKFLQQLVDDPESNGVERDVEFVRQMRKKYGVGERMKS